MRQISSNHDIDPCTASARGSKWLCGLSKVPKNAQFAFMRSALISPLLNTCPETAPAPTTHAGCFVLRRNHGFLLAE